LENGEEPFANPRNACAGTLRRLDSQVVARWPLAVYCYEILQVEGTAFASHWEILKALQGWGLRTNPGNRRVADFEEIAAYRQELVEKRDELPYEIDGIVVKLDDLALRERLGSRHRSPRWALAWKFEPKREITTLERIVVSVGPSGMLTPVALLQPVDVGGVTVSRATLHNAGEVANKDLREGDRVRIARAGDVIPEVLERLERPNKYAHKFHMPEKCPACGTPVIREGAYVRCPAGLSCRAQLRGRIAHYASRSALDIEHLGEKTAAQLVERGLVATLADLYRLEPEDVEGLEGFAEQSARQLCAAIAESRRPRLDRFLYALGIRHVGSRLAGTLAERFGTLAKLLAADRDELGKIPDVVPKIAASLIEFFAGNRQVIEELQAAGVEVRPMAGDGKGGPLAGRTFVFTGALEHYTRSEAQAAVEKLGGRATSGVSGGIDYLVAGEEPGQKLNEARDRGIRILDEGEFRKLLAGKDRSPDGG